MIRNLFLSVLSFSLLATVVSCDDEPAAEDCAGILCPFVGNWQLSEVFFDDNPSEADNSNYRLNLMAPDGENITADYSRTFEDGLSESGTWTVANNNDVIVLTTDGNEEEYIVEESGANRLVLNLHRESSKPGPDEIRYVFVK